MNLRRNQNSLSVEDKLSFVQAMLALKQKPSRLHPNDSRFGRYDDFVEIHLNAMMPPMMSPPQAGWAHQSPVFMPWHRVLLLELEKELQSVNPAVTIPYWDWTQDSSATSSLWSSDFLGGNGSGPNGQVIDGPFAGAAGKWPVRIKDQAGDPDYLRRQMAADPSARTLPTPSAQAGVEAIVPYDTAPWEDALRPNNRSAWQGFRPHAEVDLHNLVHRWVGGNMVDMTSPNDPVFWLHHCNCDRLWALWQASHPTELPYLPDSGAAAGHNLNDTMIFHAAGDPQPWDGNYRPADVLNHHALGISYDSDAPGEIPQFDLKAWKQRRGVAGKPGVTELLRRRTLPMFVLPTELPALAGTTVRGIPLNDVALKRIPDNKLFKFSSDLETTVAKAGSRRSRGAAAPPAQDYVCPIDNVSVTAQVVSRCQIGPSGTVNVQCPNGHWATYVCPGS